MHQTDLSLNAARGPVGRRINLPTTTTSVQSATTPTTTNQPPLPPNNSVRPQLISDFFIQVRNADGTVDTQLTPTVRGTEDPTPELQQSVVMERVGKTPFTVGSVGNGDFKYRATASRAPNGQIIVAAVSLRNVENTIKRLEKTELIASVSILVALGLAAWWILRVELRQLEAISKTAGAIAEGDLSQRIAAANPKTEIGKLSDALNSMLTQIEASFAERQASEDRLRRFATDASHELRTPLTAVRGYAELYRQGAVQDDEHLARVMARIESEAARMGMLVDDLLMLARLDQGRPMEFARVNVARIVGDVVEDSRAVDPTRAINIYVVSETLNVNGDAARLHQVFSNLVGNALAHTPPNTTVNVSVTTTDTEAVIEVADEGPGLSEESIERVFERFYRADSGRTRATGTTGGTGLGLSIVKSIVDAHNGTVSVTSAPDEGAVFQVRLPLF